MDINLKNFNTAQLKELLKIIKDELSIRGVKPIEHTASRKQALTAVKNFHARGGEFKPEFEAVFSKFLCSMPVTQSENFQGKRKYLRCIMAQDWSHLFQSFDDLDARYYVYAHVDPRKKDFACSEINILPCHGEPFYIGKGTGKRAWDLDRNQGHGKTLAYLKLKGYDKDQIVRVLFDNLTSRKAMEIEAKLIYFFGTLYEKGRRGTLVNLDLSLRPNFVGAMGKKLSPKLESMARSNGMPLPDPNAWKVKLAEKIKIKEANNG